jgi:YidC/Oxa1 family membrane protein insertase
MFYWLTSNVWTMGQQFLVIRNMPTPGSEAAKAREARLAKKGKLVIESTADGSGTTVVEAPKPVQRQQPVGKTRAKKSGAKK